MIELKSINKIYQNGVKALVDINLKFDKKELVFIVGESGNGKSTLLNILGCLDNPTSGEILIDGKNILEFDEDKIADIRNTYFGFVFQEFYFDKNLDVKDNILLSLEKNDSNNLDFLNLAQDLGVSDLLDRKTTELSGGQKQRIQILRTIAKNPYVILADEPTGNLDNNTKDEIYKIFKGLAKNHLVILVSHDQDAANVYANRIISIKDGSILSDEASYQTQYVLNDNIYNEIELFNYIKKIEEDKFSLNLSKQKIIPSFNLLEEKEIKRSKKISNSFINKYIKMLYKNNSLLVLGNILVLSLLIFLDMIFAFYATYNGKNVVDKYLDNNNYSNYVLYKDAEYTDILYEQKQTKLYSGDLFYNNLIDKGFKVKPVIKNTIKYDNRYFESNIMYDSNVKLDCVEISDYFALKNSLNVGKKLTISNKEYTISNIFETDYKKYDYIVKSNAKEYSIIKDELCNYHIDYIKLNYNNLKTNDLIINYSNFTLSSRIKRSENEYVNILSDKYINNNLAKNEIIVSKKFLINNNLNESIIGKKVNFINLKEDKYNGYFDNIVSLYKYYPEGAIIKSISEDNSADYYINEEIYNSLVHDYDYYNRPSFYLVENNPALKDLNNYIIEEANILSFSQEILTINGTRALTISGVVIISILIIVYLSTFVIQFISKNKQQIGLFKSFGFDNSEIKKIYGKYLRIINIFISISSIILFNIMFIYIEKKSINNMRYNQFVKDYYPYLLYVILLAYLIFSSLLRTLYFKKINKENPIVLIR